MEYSYTSTLPKSLRGLWKGETYLPIYIKVRIWRPKSSAVICRVDCRSKYLPVYTAYISQDIWICSYTVVEHCFDNLKFRNFRVIISSDKHILSHPAVSPIRVLAGHSVTTFRTTNKQTESDKRYWSDERISPFVPIKAVWRLCHRPHT